MMIKENGVKNQVYEIKYDGYLMDAENVLLHYGYSNWQDVSEKKMKKLKSCCKIDVTIPENSELNFCFRDDNQRWDNNYTNNYYFKQGVASNYDFIEITKKTENLNTTTSKTSKTTTLKTSKTTTSKTSNTTPKVEKTNSKTGSKATVRAKTVKEK